MQTLGVFTDIYGSFSEMTIGRAVLISVVGFAIVFAVLLILALFVKLMGKGFDSLNSKKTSAAVSEPETKVQTSSGTALPATQSAGKLTLTDTDEQTAAVIMAIVSNKSGIPLNRLQFNSIKLLEDK